MALVFPQYPAVPDVLEDAQNFAEAQITAARETAKEAVFNANQVLEKLGTLSVPAMLPDPPVSPTVTASYAALIQGSFDTIPNFGNINVGSLPSDFTPDDIVVPDILQDIPTYIPIILGLNIPEAPANGVFVFPVPPSVNTDIPIPDAPTPDYGLLPELLSIDLPDFEAVDIQPLTATPPVFGVAVPDVYIEWSEPGYQGHLAETIETKIRAMLDGGTGIAADVERAIWERDRERLDATSRKAVDDAANDWASRGFPLPPGMLIAAVRDVRRDNAVAVAGASREVAIKQADLEQSNMRFAVETAIKYEDMYVQIYLQVVQRSFDIAKASADLRIQVYNSQIAAFDVEQKVFQSFIDKFKADLQFSAALLDAYKVRIEAEGIKGEVNKNLVAAYTAKVQAFGSQVEAYKGLVQAANVRGELEKNKVEIYKAEVDGVSALIDAKKAEFAAYTSRVQAEQSKADLEKANAQSYQARVEAISSVANVALKQAEIKLGVSDQRLKYALGELQYAGTLAQTQLSVIQSKAATYDSATRRFTAKFEADKSVEAVNLQAVIETGRSLIAKYQADITAWNARVSQIIETAKINASSIQAAGQVASNLAAGALSGTNVSTSFGGSVSRGENNTSSQSTSETKSESETTNNSTSTNFNHNFTDA